MKNRIALVVSHPIQHFCPQYVSFAKNRDIVFKVFFASALGFKKYHDPNFKREISWGNLHLDRFDHIFLNGENVIPSDKNLDAPSLDAALAEFKPDLIIIYGYFQKLQRRAHSWAKRNGVKLAYISDSERRHRRKHLLEWIKYPYIHWYFSKIDYFLSVGNANEDFYRFYGVPDNRIERMHFPINVLQYEERYKDRLTLRTNVRSKFDISPDRIVLAVVGKLTPWKNQDHLIEALFLLEQQGFEMDLFILGSGDLLEAWKTKATILKKSRVFLPGFISIEELPAYYAAADIYVHPAMKEPHSIAVSEAIYMGCPVIVSDRCGSYGESDDVQAGLNGFVFEFGNMNDLAEKILKLASDVAMRKAFSTRSHELSVSFQQNAHRQIVRKLLTHMNDSDSQR